MYTVHRFAHLKKGELVTSGSCRHQILRGLKEAGELGRTEPFPALPRFGRILHISRPLADPRGDLIISVL